MVLQKKLFRACWIFFTFCLKNFFDFFEREGGRVPPPPLIADVSAKNLRRKNFNLSRPHAAFCLEIIKCLKIGRICKKCFNIFATVYVKNLKISMYFLIFIHVKQCIKSSAYSSSRLRGVSRPRMYVFNMLPKGSRQKSAI